MRWGGLRGLGGFWDRESERWAFHGGVELRWLDGIEICVS